MDNNDFETRFKRIIAYDRKRGRRIRTFRERSQISRDLLLYLDRKISPHEANSNEHELTKKQKTTT